MDIDKILHEAIDALISFAGVLAPAAFGSAVAQAWKTGLSWRERLLQWVVGILVSYYVTLALAAWFELGPFVVQGVGFVVAMIAFETAPRFIRAAGDAVAALPAIIRERIGSKGDVA